MKFYFTRFVVVRRNCEFCLKVVRAVNMVNKYLPDENRIRVLDNYEWEEFGFKAHPIIDKLDKKTFDGYPYMYIDGIEVDAGETEQVTIILAKILAEELIREVRVGNIMIYPEHSYV